MSDVIWLGSAVIISVVIYLDAKKRKLKDPFSWAVVSLVLGIVGLACYFWWVIKPNKRGSKA